MIIISKRFSRRMPATDTAAQMPTQPMATILSSWSNFSCKGVGPPRCRPACRRSCPFHSPCRWPPQWPLPRPLVITRTHVDCLQFAGSEVGLQGLGRVFSTGSDSPLSSDSSAYRLVEERMRASAGTRSPALRRNTSPTTIWEAGTETTSPSRITWAAGQPSP